MGTWEMKRHKDVLWYVFELVGWVTERRRTRFANVTDT